MSGDSHEQGETRLPPSSVPPPVNRPLPPAQPKPGAGSGPKPDRGKPADAGSARPPANQAVNLGIYDVPRTGGISATELIAIALTALWLALVVGFWVLSDWETQAGKANSLTFVMTLLAVFLPVAIIWIGAVAARSARIMRAEATRLQHSIDALRQSYVAQAQSTGMGVKPSVEKKLDEIAAAQRQAENALASFASSRGTLPADTPAVSPRETPQPPADRHGQAALELGTPAEALEPVLSIPDFIRALNFPENVDDQQGFAALRRALRDRKTARMVQASQDVLTLLSQDGIYMDDLHPDRARPEFWRRFARGDRGESIAPLGGVRDRSSLAISAGRMRQDTIFRDAVHHFLRQFDQTFVEFETHASDQDIAEFADTRTARAFMLLGRIAGTFD